MPMVLRALLKERCATLKIFIYDQKKEEYSRFEHYRFMRNEGKTPESHNLVANETRDSLLIGKVCASDLRPKF